MFVQRLWYRLASANPADGGIRLAHLVHVIKGLLIGVANIIPGVSGGTFALILGIYERLINALRAIGPRTLQAAGGLLVGRLRAPARQRFVQEARRTDLLFLGEIGVAACTAVVACSWIIDYCLRVWPGQTLAFFMGLIIPSILIPYRMMTRRSIVEGAWLVPGAALTVGVALAYQQAPDGGANLPYTFVCGAIAISAMILPGLSGSFVLLVMGMYQPTVEHLKGLTSSPAVEDLVFLGVLGLGIVVGLFSFARVMAVLLARYRSQTLAFLIGLILGSFWILWPFKDFTIGSELVGRGAEVQVEMQIATAPNVWPDSARQAATCSGALLVGLVGGVGMNRLGRREE